jgi:hypothetical protein
MGLFPIKSPVISAKNKEISHKDERGIATDVNRCNATAGASSN